MAKDEVDLRGYLEYLLKNHIRTVDGKFTFPNGDTWDCGESLKPDQISALDKAQTEIGGLVSDAIKLQERYANLSKKTKIYKRQIKEMQAALHNTYESMRNLVQQIRTMGGRAIISRS